MTSASFTAKIVSDNRVTIQKTIMELLDLEIGDLVHVTIQKAEVKK